VSDKRFRDAVISDCTWHSSDCDSTNVALIMAKISSFYSDRSFSLYQAGQWRHLANTNK